jgi:hypothetical protein
MGKGNEGKRSYSLDSSARGFYLAFKNSVMAHCIAVEAYEHICPVRNCKQLTLLILLFIFCPTSLTEQLPHQLKYAPLFITISRAWRFALVTPA